jgi:hypothetical protein
MFGQVYYVDCSSLMELDGRQSLLSGSSQTPSFARLERGLIWAGLESIAADGRLKLVKQIRAELGRWHPTALARLDRFEGCRVPPTTNDLRRRYQELIANHPRWAPRTKYDPGDPWLIVSTQKFGGVLVTEELHAADQTRPRKSRPKIPDVCDAVGVPYYNLRQLAEVEQWLT